MKVEDFVNILDADFYTGVPDSQLKSLCNYLLNKYGIDSMHHVIAANEGNSTALAAGYYLATGKVPVVYMQNSGEGNIINPVASLINDKVYGIPVIFVIGWRGEYGVPDEPQHIYQGEVTIQLLKCMDIQYYIVGKETDARNMQEAMDGFKKVLFSGKQVAFVIRKDSIFYKGKNTYKNKYNILREDVIQHIVKISEYDLIISTTGKTSRELFEIRENNYQSHKYDFLTVGSMGHASSIALGISLHQPGRKVWCIDGDGALLMHMGAMAIIGSSNPKNLVHIVINNEAHESVGGMPTAAKEIDIVNIALACGYTYAVSVNKFEELDNELKTAKIKNELTLIEVKCAIGSKNNLGRPSLTPLENKQNFMEYIKELNKKHL